MLIFPIKGQQGTPCVCVESSSDDERQSNTEDSRMVENLTTLMSEKLITLMSKKLKLKMRSGNKIMVNTCLRHVVVKS